MRGRRVLTRVRRFAPRLLSLRASQALSLLGERGAHAPRRALAREVLLGVARAPAQGRLARLNGRLRVARLGLQEGDARASLGGGRARAEQAAARHRRRRRAPPRRRLGGARGGGDGFRGFRVAVRRQRRVAEHGHRAKHGAGVRGG